MLQSEGDDLVMRIRKHLLAAFETEESLTFDRRRDGKFGLDDVESDRLVDAYNVHTEKAAELFARLEQIDGVDLLLPILGDDNPRVLCHVASFLSSRYPEQTNAVFKQILRLKPRELKPPLTDLTHFFITEDAEKSIWLQEHGSLNGYWDRPSEP